MSVKEEAYKPAPEEQVPDEYLREIGMVTVRWNALEALIGMCLIKVMGREIDDTRSHIAFAHMAFPQKLDCMSAMIAELQLPQNSPLLKYKQEVQPLLKEAQQKRNSVIHAGWGMDGGKVHRTSLSARGSLKYGTTAVSLEELKAVSALIVRAGQTLLNAVIAPAGRSAAPQSGQKAKG